MIAMSLLAARTSSRALRTAQSHRLAAALFSSKTGGGVKVDVEHFASGWDDFVQDIEEFRKTGSNTIQTFNKISSLGLSAFDPKTYKVSAATESTEPANALMLRSHKLQLDQVDVSVRAIARCGAGTNNIPVKDLTDLGIPVFNTPGANANAVKELILCGLLLGSRKIVDGINHMKALGEQGLARERVGTCVASVCSS